MTASVSSELAEQLLGFTAVAATDSYNKNEELPLDMIHDTLKSKTTFIAQVRPGNTKDTNLRTPKTMNSLKNSPQVVFRWPVSFLQLILQKNHVLFPRVNSALTGSKPFLQQKVNLLQ